MPSAEHRSPMRTLNVANVCDRRAAHGARSRKAPAHPDPFQSPILTGFDYGSDAFGEDFKNRIDTSLAPFLEAIVLVLFAGFADVGGVAVAHAASLNTGH